MTPPALADLRTRLPACDLAVYADIRSRTVLGSDGALRYPQEYLDALAACAAVVFGSGTGAQFGAGAVDHVLFASPTGARAFFRAGPEASEALCCIFGPEVDLRAAREACRAALDAGVGGAV